MTMSRPVAAVGVRSAYRDRRGCAERDREPVTHVTRPVGIVTGKMTSTALTAGAASSVLRLVADKLALYRDLNTVLLKSPVKIEVSLLQQRYHRSVRPSWSPAVLPGGTSTWSSTTSSPSFRGPKSTTSGWVIKLYYLCDW